MKNWFKSVSILGALGTAIGFVSDPAVLNLLPHKTASLITAVCGVLTVFGIRRKLPAPE